jgi:hypothetical protein
MISECTRIELMSVRPALATRMTQIVHKHEGITAT